MKTLKAVVSITIIVSDEDYNKSIEQIRAMSTKEQMQYTVDVLNDECASSGVFLNILSVDDEWSDAE